MAVGPLLVFKSEIGEGSDDLVTDFKIKSIFSKRNLCSEVSCHENCNKKAIMRLLPWVLLLIVILESFIFPHNCQISLNFKPGFFSFPSLFTFTMPLATFSKLNLLDICKDKVLQKMKWWYINDPVMERKYWMPTSALLCFLSSFLDYFTIVFVSFMIKHFLKLGVIQTLLLRSNLRLAWLLWLKPKQNLTMILENFGKS